MRKFKRILFATQGLMDDREALKQALFLTVNNNAQFKGLVTCPPLPAEMADYKTVYENALLGSLHQNIQTIRQENHIDPHLPLPIEIMYGEKPSFVMIKQVLQHPYDLLIKEAEPIEVDKTGFKAIDMTLLRKCPCPIWLHRPNIEEKPLKQIAVAIDAHIVDEEQRVLALRLLELASDIANNFNCQLHIISCWEYELEHYLDQHVWIKLDEQELNTKLEKAEAQNRATLDALIKEVTINNNALIHHLHGSPSEHIPNSVTENNIDLLVMGTLGRSGIPGMIIGNTVENILQAINCSLVAVKPQGFTPPI